MSDVMKISDKEKEKTVKSVLKLYRVINHIVNNKLVYLEKELYTTSRKQLSDMYLKKRFNGGKAPLIKDLRAEQKALLAEKDKLYESYYSEKSELSELQATMKNVDMILGRDKAQEQERSKKRMGELE